MLGDKRPNLDQRRSEAERPLSTSLPRSAVSEPIATPDSRPAGSRGGAAGRQPPNCGHPKLVAQSVMRIRDLSIVLFVAATACGRPPSPTARCPELVGLSSRIPSDDAQVALKAGDHRLLSLGGFSSVAPGADSRKGNQWHFRQLSGTTDSETRACLDLRPLAENYARLYNQAVLARSGNGS